MKKRTKKLLAIGMAAIMTAGLAVGCGKKATPENLLTDMGKNLAGIESAVMKLEVGAKMTDGTDTIGFEMGLDMESVLKTKDSHAKGKVNLEMMGTSIGTEIEMYNVKEDDKYVTYMMAADEWSKEEIDAEDIDSASTTEDFEKMAEDIAKHADAFTLSEEKTEVDGKKCFELKGEIDGGEVSDLMENDMMGELSSAGMDSDMLADMKIPCTIAIYEKEILPAKISLDMKSAMKELAEESGVEISEFYLDLIYVDFDSVDEIKVPEEVKTEAKGIGLEDLYEEAYDDEVSDVEKKPVEPAKQSDDLGKTWNSYTVQINDKVLTLPCTLADLENAGVTLDREYTPENYIVNIDEYELAWFLDESENEIVAEMANTTDQPIELKDCVVTGISVDTNGLEEGGLTVIFPGGIRIGSPEKDVLTAYGEPNDRYENDEGGKSFTWFEEDHYMNGCMIDIEEGTGVVDYMSLTCYK